MPKNRRPDVNRRSGANRRPGAGFLALWLLVPAGLLHAEPMPEERGLAIAEEADRRDDGFGDSSSAVEMVLRNRQGEESRRFFRMKILEVPDKRDGDKSLIVFDRPRDVSGTGLLTFTHITEPDDQWLYLPALKRVKRISSKNKSGPFMGSEFAYEDLNSQEVAKYTHKYLRDEPCGDLSCFVLERIPVYANTGYTRQVTWIDQAEYRVQKVEYYDRKGDLLKTLRLGDYRQYLGHVWRAHDLYMENHQTGKTTRMVWSDYVFANGFDDRDFSRDSLKRVR